MSSTAPPRPLSRSCGMSAALGRPLWPRWPHSLAARLAAHQRVRGLTRVRASLAWAGTWHGTWKQGGYVDETPGTVEGSERRRERAREGERGREKAREGERRREKAREGERRRENAGEGERRREKAGDAGRLYLQMGARIESDGENEARASPPILCTPRLGVQGEREEDGERLSNGRHRHGRYRARTLYEHRVHERADLCSRETSTLALQWRGVWADGG